MVDDFFSTTRGDHSVGGKAGQSGDDGWEEDAGESVINPEERFSSTPLDTTGTTLHSDTSIYVSGHALSYTITRINRRELYVWNIEIVMDADITKAK